MIEGGESVSTESQIQYFIIELVAIIKIDWVGLTLSFFWTPYFASFVSIALKNLCYGLE